MDNGKAEAYLRKAYPSRIAFSEEEKEMAAAVLEAFLNKDGASLPNRYVEVGEVFQHEGKTYRCVKRGCIGIASNACKGCDIMRKYRGCGSLQCSSFDRKDGQNVWFIEDEG